MEGAFGSPASVEIPKEEEEDGDEEDGVVPTMDAARDPDLVLAEFDAAAEAILRGEKSDAAAKMLADAAAAAAASKPAAGGPDDEDDIEDEIGYVDVRPAPGGEDSDDDNIVDEVGVVERSELSVTASSIPEESIALHRGSSRSKSSSDGAAAGDEPSPTRSEDSLDDRYKVVTAKHEDVQRWLRARHRELRAAELAAKQMKIREMEEELARLERIDAGASLADEAAFEADIAGYDVEDKLQAHQERLARLEETVEARRLEALALRKTKSMELDLMREIHTLDSDIERIGRTDGEVASGSPSRAAAVSYTHLTLPTTPYV